MRERAAAQRSIANARCAMSLWELRVRRPSWSRSPRVCKRCEETRSAWWQSATGLIPRCWISKATNLPVTNDREMRDEQDREQQRQHEAAGKRTVVLDGG